MESAAAPTPGGAGVTPPAAPGETETALKRVVSRRMLTLFVLGDVLGAGVYALIGNIIGETGGAVWTAFLAAAVMAAFTAASYAELVTKFPRAGGAAHYIQNAFRTPALTFTIAFAVMCTGLTSAATLASAFGGVGDPNYLETLIDTTFSSTTAKIVAVAFLVGVALINARGISESVKINLGLTAIEVSGLLLVMIIGIGFFIGGDAQGAPDADAGRAFEFKDGESVFLAIFAGAAVAFYALIGFEDSVNVAEETHDPPASYPRALLYGLGGAAVIYLAIGLTVSIAVPTGQLADQEANGASLLQVVQLGPLSVDTKIFSAIALFALANGALINLIMASRLIYGMADQGIMPRPFRQVLPGRRTPWVAIVFTSLIAVGLIVYGELEDLAGTTVLLLVAVFAVVNGAVLVLRRVRVEHRHFTTPPILPVLGIVASIGILIQKISDDSANKVDLGVLELAKTVTIAVVLLVLGVVLWAVNRLLGGERLSEERLLAAEDAAGE